MADRRIMAIAALIFLLFNSAAAWCGTAYIEVSHANDGTLVWCAPTGPSQTFRLDYTHSVDLTPIDELYKIGGDGEIVLTDTSFVMIGAGVEFYAGVGQLSIEGNRIHLTGLNRSIKRYLLRVGVTANQRLTVHENTVRLLDIANPGDLVEIKVR